MKTKLIWATTILAGSFLIPPVSAGDLSGYTVGQLLEPCIEGDNDSRWGAAAEAECEQYITGFTDAFQLFKGSGKASGVCLPKVNRPDEVRWAFMRWAHKNFDKRDMPAVEGLMTTIQTAFPCK